MSQDSIDSSFVYWPCGHTLDPSLSALNFNVSRELSLTLNDHLFSVFVLHKDSPVHPFNPDLIVLLYLLVDVALAQTWCHGNERSQLFLDFGIAPTALPNQFNLFDCGQAGGPLEADQD